MGVADADADGLPLPEHAEGEFAELGFDGGVGPGRLFFDLVDGDVLRHCKVRPEMFGFFNLLGAGLDGFAGFGGLFGCHGWLESIAP